MKKRFGLGMALALLLILLGAVFIYLQPQKAVIPLVEDISRVVSISPQITKKPKVDIVNPPQSSVLSQSNFIAQTFNNCGPASLSMVMSMFGKHVSQGELAEKMRPFNNPYGGIDDKSIFAEEFVTYAQEYGFNSMHRYNGNTELLKKFVANGIPVVVRTWLNPYEDIGHFRIVRGYDDARGVIIQDDSYQGPNLEYSYDEFNKLWQPFNYGYILVYPPEKQAVVEEILGEEMDSEVALNNSIKRAESELAQNPSFYYSLFNLSTAYYHLGDHQKSASYYEQAAPNLPPRMFWYQIEPVENYLALKQYNRVNQMADSLLYSGNLAFSEMYNLKGKALEEQGDIEGARAQYQSAVYYNKNYKKAIEALENI